MHMHTLLTPHPPVSNGPVFTLRVSTVLPSRHLVILFCVAAFYSYDNLVTVDLNRFE